MNLSPDLSVMLSPLAVYQRLATERATDDRFALALRRPAFVALLVATVVTMSATGRITAGLLLSVGLCWSIATAVQAAAGLTIIMTSPSRRVSVARALDLLFLAHGPWSLWLLASAVWATVSADFTETPRLALAATLALPFAWTAVLIFAFCRAVLDMPPPTAVTKTCLHQVAIWSFAGAYFSIATQVWPRLLGLVGR